MEANPNWKDRCSDPATGGHPDGGTGHISGLDAKFKFGLPIMLAPDIAKEAMEFELVGGRFLRLKSLRKPLLVRVGETEEHQNYLEMLVGQYLIGVDNCRGQFCSIRGMSFEDILEEFKVEPSSGESRQVATSMRSSRIRLFFVRRPDVIFANPVLAAELGLTEIVRFLIEEKGLNVNGSWGGIGIGSPRNTLLLTSLLASTDIRVFRYLLTVPGADFGFRHDYNVESLQLESNSFFDSWSVWKA